MDAGFLDVLHHPADQHVAGVVADGVDVDLGRVAEESVDQHRALGRQAALLAERPDSASSPSPRELVSIVHDLHRATTEHVAGPHQHREADLVGDRERLLQVDGRATGRLRNLQLVAQLLPALAVLGGIDRLAARCRRRARAGSRRTASAASGRRADTITPIGLLGLDRR